MGRRALAVLLAAASIMIGAQAATAEPVTGAPGVVVPELTAPDGSYVESIEVQDERNIRLQVRSTAMDMTIPVDVLRPADTSEPRPTLYLLSGAGGGIDTATWKLRTDALEFLSDKNINVVQIMANGFAFYTDWLRRDPVLGLNKWDTYLSEELPPLIDAALNTNGVNAIAGLSMAGVAVLNLVRENPGMFRSVAVYSGITQTSDPIAREAVRLTVEVWGGGDVENMWGAPDNPLWELNDPTIHAEGLRGTNIFVSTGNGIPGIYDIPGGPFREEPPIETPKTVAIGAFIEANVDMFNRNLQNRLHELGIPATFVYRDSGTHSWGYWQDDLKTSWPVLAQGLYSAP
ncbi:esterase family protein [Nocardia otitidiscaviarum]|uniref:alpha/beta hydrolase n=1 Tax=Nocardia otitidiscaviarum TaxID=1823 RepID=UPI0006939C12|nr:alpha/beta hydrolase family protein [Nocardia otitidiscaviarum]MBF6137692.1 esterase family protein [Nocardia otitidiscaviarum]MBF6488600.1 esterase family protein [Nocardia otitidiscaviarum]